MNENKHSTIGFPAHRGDFLDWATSEDDSCLSVAGLAIRCGLGSLRERPGRNGLRILGQLIEYSRRQLGLSLEELSRRTSVDLGELLAIERDDVTPTPRALYQLAQYLHLPLGKLQELSGLVEPRDDRLNEAALRFAARSSPPSSFPPLSVRRTRSSSSALVGSTD